MYAVHTQVIPLPPFPRLQALKREIKVKEVNVLDAARHRFLSNQQTVRETELARMDTEIQRKVSVHVHDCKEVGLGMTQKTECTFSSVEFKYFV